MLGALEAVKGGLGVNSAAREFGVPASTLIVTACPVVLYTVQTQAQART